MVKFSSSEIRDIIISMLVIAAVFSYVLSGRNFEIATQYYFISLVGVGSGFVLHELAHKLMAIRYGFWAEYRLWVEGLFLAVVTAYFGFVFAAPGAVYIHGTYIKDDENGKISLAGPVTNIILALFFFALIPLFPANSTVGAIAFLGYYVNSFLALFNLIPFSVLDGAKVFRWNPLVW
ncbi:MAG: metalloprotease, partial [Euryarchaeota archaeon]|nr:metalloprotease [Euryarchaeota archaeon]